MNSKRERFLFFWLIFLLPTQLNKFFWPDFSYIYSLKIDYLALSIHFWDLLLYLLIAVWISKKPRINITALTVLLIFLVFQLPALFVAQNIGAGLSRYYQFVNVFLFGLYISSQDWEVFRRLKIALGLSVIFFSTIAIFQFMAGRSLGFWFLGERDFTSSTPLIATFNYYGQVFLRPYATFPHPNVLSAFLLIALILLLFSNKKIRSDLPALFLGSLTILLTFSRAAIALLILTLAFHLRGKLRFLLMVLILIFPLLFVRFSSAFNFDYLSLLRREELAEVAIKMFLQEPILGVGLNNFLVVLSKTDLISGTSRFLQPVHNIFLLSLAETGVIGFAGLMLFLGHPILKLWKQRKQSIIAKSLLWAWGVIIFLGSFDHYFLTLAQGQRLLFLVWGLSVLEYLSGESQKDS